MSAEELIRYGSQAGFLALFAIVAARTLRNPIFVNLLALAFFGVAAALVCFEWFIQWRLSEPLDEWVLNVRTTLILLFPVAMLFLADAFVRVRQRYLLAASTGLVASLVIIALTEEDNAGSLLVVPLLYFLLTQGYATARFATAARDAAGLGRKRLLAVCVGSAMLIVLVALAIPAGIAPRYSGLWASLSSLAGLAAGLAFLAGFAPPRLLRAAWQTEEIRRSLNEGQASTWVALASDEEFAAAVQADIRSILGADAAVLWLTNEEEGTPDALHAASADIWAGAQATASNVYATNRPLLQRVRPEDPDDDRRGTRMAAPVTRGGRRWGVISVVDRAGSAFADDDLWLLTLLADHVAFALDHREILAELSSARAREEADTLKEEFLSSVAHDLQTPLTTVLGEAQLIDRRLAQDPPRPVERPAIGRIVTNAQRMRQMVRDLLDFTRAERVSLVTDIAPVDVSELAHRAAAQTPGAERIQVESAQPAIVLGDEARLLQVIENLLGNAIKYSAGTVRLTVSASPGEIQVSISDQGIGIAREDLPHVFDRFWRSRSIDDRRYAGIGLGLFITRRIIEEHGGTITAASTVGVGSTFTMTLPAYAAEANGQQEIQWQPPTS